MLPRGRFAPTVAANVGPRLSGFAQLEIGQDGKLGVLLALNLAVTLLPGLMLYLVALSLAPDLFWKWSLAWIAPAVVAQSLAISIVMSLVALAVGARPRGHQAGSRS